MASVEHVSEGLKTVLKITKDAPVVIEAIKGRLFFGTHNEYHSVLFECPTDWDDFKMVLSYSIAKELPKSISGKSVKFELVDDNSVKVFSEGTRLKLALLDKSALSLASLVKKYKKTPDWEVNGQELSSALDRVKHSANDKSIGDMVLRGYHLTQKGSSLELMASNGASMSVSSFPIKNSHNEIKGTVLLNPEFSQISQILFEDTEIGVGEDSISFESSFEGKTIRVVSLLTSGKAFDYEKVLKMVRDNKFFVTFDSKSLSEAVKRTDFFTDETLKYRVSIKVALDDYAEISSQNHYGNSLIRIETLENNLDNEMDFEISGAALMKYLSNSTTGSVTMWIKDSSSPVVFQNGLSTEVIVLFSK